MGISLERHCDGPRHAQAVVAADPRLFAKFGNHAEYGAAVFGFGYDANDDGDFEIDDGTAFDAAGIAFVPGPADGTMSIDPGDYYTEGWARGFWRYLAAVANPFDGGTWEDRHLGVDSRSLSDGDWDSFTFETTTVPIPPFDAQPANPIAALPPPAILPGDFDHDGHVDAVDYTLWRSTFGSLSQFDADGNADGTVDAADYVVWRNRSTANPASSSALRTPPVPEPASLAALEIAMFLIPLLVRQGEALMNSSAPLVGCHRQFVLRRNFRESCRGPVCGGNHIVQCGSHAGRWICNAFHGARFAGADHWRGIISRRRVALQSAVFDERNCFRRRRRPYHASALALRDTASRRTRDRRV